MARSPWSNLIRNRGLDVKQRQGEAHRGCGLFLGYQTTAQWVARAPMKPERPGISGLESRSSVVSTTVARGAFVSLSVQSTTGYVKTFLPQASVFNAGT
jgi:hypothetical protein